MPGRASQSRPLQILGVIVTVVAVLGTVVLDWEWGTTDDVVPLVIGASVAAVAVGWTLYSYFG